MMGVGGGTNGSSTTNTTNTFAPSKLSSADLLTSFRRFNATLGSSQAGKNLSNNNNNNLPKGNGNDDDDQDDDDFENQSLNSAEGSMNPKEQVAVADLEDSIHSMRDDTSFKQNNFYHHHHHQHQVERVTVSTKESFNDTYLSSLSSTTFSIQSLKSPDGRSAFPTHTSSRQHKTEPPARPRPTNLGMLPEATKENSTSTQTMKSEIVTVKPQEPSSHVSTHSAARSIISSSSTNREPPAGKLSSSHDLPNEADGVVDPAVLETVVQETVTNDGGTGTNVSSGEMKEGVEKEDQKDLATADDETSLSNRLTGLVFNDTDDEKQKVRIPMEPDAKQSELSTRPSKVLNDSKQGPSAENDGVDQKVRHTTTQNHGSSSTKETVSISIRSGLSSIQTESLTGIPAQTLEGKIPEGSTSIRSGLSGIQQSPRRMSSQLEHSNSLRGSGRQQDQIGSMHRELENVPETIAEDQSKLTSPDIIIQDNSDEEKSLFSGLKPSSTNDDSSVGNKRPDVLPGGPQLPSSVSVNQKRLGPLVSTRAQAISSNVEINSHPDRQPNNGNEENDEIFPSSTRSRPMGNNSVSKRVENSPNNVARRELVQQDSASLFSSVDDDVSEDIFGGLEDDNGSKFASLKKETENQKVGTQTPIAKQRICDDGGNNAAELPLLETQRVRKYANGEKKQRKDSKKKSSKPMAKRSQTQTSAKKRRKSLPVNSDSSSSLVGDPITSPNVGTETKRRTLRRGSDIPGSSPLKDSKLKSPVSRSNSGRKSMSSRRSPASERRASLPSEKREFIDLNRNNQTTKINSVESKLKSDFVNGRVEDKKADSVFASLSCGLTDHCNDVFARMCLSEQKTEMPINTEDEAEKSSISGNSSAELTALEKKVWTEWDRLNEDADVQTTTNEAQEEKVDEKKEEQKRKREQAREELLEIASMAMNPNLSESTKKEDGKDSRAPVVSEPIVSASVSTDSKPSTASGGSDTNSFSDSGYSQSSSFSHEEMSHGNISTGNGSDACSEILSKEPLPSTPTNSSRRGVQSPSVASPILLSSSQRNLIERFSKQLTSVGIEVLKLNTKRKWQIRHLTVSKEMIPLSAHQAISKSEDLTSCHKALLWLKKFNRTHHGDGYGISNIDKNGHGGMLLVDLSEIKVSNVAEDLVENPLPKKLHEPFKDSVLVTMDYKINGSRRSIELRCKNDDEAQFLCTCTRLVRDMLRREKSLRQKSKSNKFLSDSGQRIPPQNVI